jgi:hypothetical protein
MSYKMSPIHTSILMNGQAPYSVLNKSLFFFNESKTEYSAFRVAA